jgi:sulfur-oxidizing protein SoxZ
MAETIKIRATLQGDVADVRVLVNHPMETGQRKNERGELIPPHFLTVLTASHNGRTVMEAHWSQGVARNPPLGFRVRGAKAGDKIGVSWVDNKGERSSVEATVLAS